MSAKGIVEHMQQFVANVDTEFLPRDVHRGPDILIHSLDGHGKGFTEDVQTTVATDEPHKVIAARPGFGKGKPGRLSVRQITQRCAVLREKLKGRLASKAAVSM